ncbi:MAG: hypothetical protein FWH53_11645 [Leptospirales bacterium]|nr:hypothetical protein [Leptospirales bacterium]
MKKYLLLTLIAICIGLIIPCKVYAVDITVGATTWYTWFDGGEGSPDFDPAFFLGPALSVKFNEDFNLTFVYLYGKFDAKDEDFKIKRQDCDIALNYRLNDYFKVFGGLKYIRYSFTSFEEFGYSVYESDGTDYAYGPGLGLSATYPIADNLFILATLSGFYLWDNQKVKTTEYSMGYPSPYGPTSEEVNYKQYGFNSTLSIAYYIAPASTVISLGGRFQRFIDSDDSSFKMTFYGITLTATYTFNI